MNPIIEQLKQAVGQTMEQSPSPMGRWLNGVLVSAEEGHLIAEYEVRSDMTNPAGILHGGAVAAILDDLIGMTVYSLNRTAFFATTNLGLDFLSTVKLGEKVIAKTQIIRSGKTMINVEGRLFDIHGKLLAKASSNLVSSHMKYQEGAHVE